VRLAHAACVAYANVKRMIERRLGGNSFPLLQHASDSVGESQAPNPSRQVLYTESLFNLARKVNRTIDGHKSDSPSKLDLIWSNARSVTFAQAADNRPQNPPC